MDSGKQLKKIIESLPEEVKLVAVSKFHEEAAIMSCYQEGQRVFGESRVQELITKEAHLPKDIAWHFIGHLQTNKVRFIAPFVDLIHSVDSLKVLKEIDKCAKNNDRVIRCLLQLHVAEEDTKFGLSKEGCREILESDAFAQMKHVKVVGVMCMATNTEQAQQVAQEFDRALEIFEWLKRSYFSEQSDFAIKSWGMSHDYGIAIEHGANLVRIGSSIFGARK